MRFLKHCQEWPQRQRLSAVSLQRLWGTQSARSGAARLLRGGERENTQGLPRTRIKTGNQPHFRYQSQYIDPLAEKKGREVSLVADGLRPAEENDVLELDECWTYVRKRSNKRWLWVALCRRTRQVVAFVIGNRSARTCARLWSRIPEGYRQGRSFSDFWKSYRPVFAGDPSHRQVGKSSGELAHVERFFGRLRQKLARYVRRTRAASQSERMLHLTTKLFVDWYNEAVT